MRGAAAPGVAQLESSERGGYRRRSINVTRGAAAPSVSTLLAAERKSYLHLYYVKPGTTVQQVVEHLQNIFPGANCNAESLKPRGDYASFKLSVPTKLVGKCLLPEHWPEDVHIKPWRSGFRKQAGKDI